MNEPAASTEPPRPSEHSIWHNWITLAGAILAVASLFAFILLFALDLLGREATNPYIGILCYVVAPGFLFAGGALVLGGAWLQRRHQAKTPLGPRPRLAIDLSRPRDRRVLAWFTLGTTVFLLLTAVGSYQTYVFTESNTFCGEVCHSVMGPEFTAYHRTAHAKVACVECHVGSGAMSYFQAKFNGTGELFSLLTNHYERPILASDHILRTTRETCTQCHWSELYVGDVERTYNHYLADDKNTPYTVRLLVNVGGGSPAHGPVGGIHWHMNVANKVEYLATDAQRQTIPWVRMTNAQGVVTVYRTAGFKGDPDPKSIRRMDCIDCHNRPAHRHSSPDEAVDEALYLGQIDAKLPAVKRIVVDLLAKGYRTKQAAAAGLEKELNAKYHGAANLGATVAAAQAIYRANFFPEMKADWSKYPDNLSHLDSAGCFRCHDGKHVADGDSHRMPATDCNSCHTIIAQGAGAELAKMAPAGQPFKHPSSDIDGLGLLCSDCHNGKNQDQ